MHRLEWLRDIFDIMHRFTAGICLGHFLWSFAKRDIEIREVWMTLHRYGSRRAPFVLYVDQYATGTRCGGLVHKYPVELEGLPDVCHSLVNRFFVVDCPQQ